MIQRLELDRPRCRPAGARPLRVMFLLTSMPVGGAETLLVNLIRTLDRERFDPLVACLKERDVLGEKLAEDVPVFDRLIGGKYDVRVLPRLRKLMKQEQVDAVVTVGAGDKMFWGRLAARAAGVPVVLSALHSTGWPDGIGRLNRCLTPITDGFIAVAESHAEFQVDVERFPREKVYLVPNGIDTQRFQYSGSARQRWRKRLGIDTKAPVVGIVAALRPEKNHQLFLQTAAQIAIQLPQTRFVIAGDGPLRSILQQQADSLGIGLQTSFLGSVEDVPGVLSMMDLFCLTSDNEASPVSILEALACQRAVVAPDVGSIGESVIDGDTGYLYPCGDQEALSERWLALLTDRGQRRDLGAAGRAHVQAHGSLESMTEGYSRLIESLFVAKQTANALSAEPASSFLPAGWVRWSWSAANQATTPR